MNSQPKALVVDDNKTNVALLKAALDAFNIPFDAAYSGAEAIQMLNQGNYLAVLLDYHMPGLDGAEILHWINQNMEKRPFIIVVTADNGGATRARFDNLGCDAYIVKPVVLSSLFEALAPVMSTKNFEDCGN